MLILRKGTHSAKAWIAVGTEIATHTGNQRRTEASSSSCSAALWPTTHEVPLPPEASPVGPRLQWAAATQLFMAVMALWFMRWNGIIQGFAVTGLGWRLAGWGSSQPRQRSPGRCRRRVGVETTGRVNPHQPFHPTVPPFIHKSSLQRRGLVRDKADTTPEPHQRAFFLCLCLVKSVRPLISDVDFWHLPYSGHLKNRLLSWLYWLWSVRLLRSWSEIQYTTALSVALWLLMHKDL